MMFGTAVYATSLIDAALPNLREVIPRRKRTRIERAMSFGASARSAAKVNDFLDWFPFNQRFGR